MHGYSIDSDERRVVPLLLAFLAITLAWLTSNLLALIHLHVPWWVDAPSVMAYPTEDAMYETAKLLVDTAVKTHMQMHGVDRETAERWIRDAMGGT